MITPTKYYILVQVPEEGREKTATGLYLPQQRSEVHQKGVVVKKTEGQDFEKGDVIWFRRWAGEEIEYNKKKYILINIYDIIATERRSPQPN